MYFVKHGAELFQSIDKIGTQYHDETGCQILPKNKLMPELIKMCQNNITVSNEELNTIVSHKKNLTLRDYLAEHKLIDSTGKKYNTACLEKKYKYLDAAYEKIPSSYRLFKQEIANPSVENAPEKLALK